MKNSLPLERLKHHVTGAIERGEAAPITSVPVYSPMFLSWCKSYEEEERELREYIEGNPADVKQLKEEYKQLTGKQYRRKGK